MIRRRWVILNDHAGHFVAAALNAPFLGHSLLPSGPAVVASHSVFHAASLPAECVKSRQKEGISDGAETG